MAMVLGRMGCGQVRGVWIVKRKRLTGEIRFRISKRDQERVEWLLNNIPEENTTVSALLRRLIYQEYDRLFDLHTKLEHARR